MGTCNVLYSWMVLATPETITKYPLSVFITKSIIKWRSSRISQDKKRESVDHEEEEAVAVAEETYMYFTRKAAFFTQKEQFLLPQAGAQDTHTKEISLYM